MDIKQNISLKKYTTVGIGGKAKYFAVAESNDDFVRLVDKYIDKVFVLGRGSNLLISDEGYDGLVILNRTNKVVILEKLPTDAQILRLAGVNKKVGRPKSIKITREDYADIQDFWKVSKTSKGFEGIDIADFDDTKYPIGYVYVDAGVMLPFLIKHSIENGLTGLQWFARIPATIGGAIYNNIHGAKHLLSEFVERVVVFKPGIGVYVVDKGDCHFGYDFSRFKQTGEYILGAVLKLYKGDTKKAEAIYNTWLTKKAIQPQNSPGCAFVNLTEETKDRLGLPTVSTGYLIDQVLHMKGYRVGDAMVYERHANFIVNVADASFRDYMRVIKDIKLKAKEKLDVDLKLEIQVLGGTGLLKV